MHCSFSIPVTFDGEVRNDDSKRGACRFLTDTIKGLNCLPYRFGQLPFENCVVTEAVDRAVRHGKQLKISELDQEISDWFSSFIDLAETEIRYNQQKDEGSIDIYLSDDGMTFGYRVAAQIKGSDQTYHFIVVPVTDDICADKETPYLFELILNGGQKK